MLKICLTLKWKVKSFFFLPDDDNNMLWRGISLTLVDFQGGNRRECLQQDEEGGEVVHLWILQKTKGERSKYLSEQFWCPVFQYIDSFFFLLVFCHRG